MKQDFIGFLALVAISAVIGLGVNQFRANPLPLVYQTPGERLAATVVGRNSVEGGEWRVKRDAWTVTGISLDELRSLLGKPEVLILDARPTGFYKRGHIPSALSLSKLDFQRDFTRLLPRLREISRDPRHTTHDQIVVYCYDADCDDGEIVAQALVQLGFAPVRVFKGGWEAWKAARLPVEGQ